MNSPGIDAIDVFISNRGSYFAMDREGVGSMYETALANRALLVRRIVPRIRELEYSSHKTESELRGFLYELSDWLRSALVDELRFDLVSTFATYQSARAISTLVTLCEELNRWKNLRKDPDLLNIRKKAISILQIAIAENKERAKEIDDWSVRALDLIDNIDVR